MFYKKKTDWMEKIKIKKESSNIFVNGNIPISLGLLLCERAAAAVAINVSCAIEMKMNKLRIPHSIYSAN